MIKDDLRRYAHRTKATPRKKQKAYHFNRAARRAMLQLASRLQRKKAKLEGPARVKCPVCNLFYIAPAMERCQCKVKKQEYRYNPD